MPAEVSTINANELINTISRGLSTTNPIGPETLKSFIYASRHGLKYSVYNKLFRELESIINLSDWADYLNVNRRTLERYRKEKKKLDTAKSERLLQISIIINTGLQVFGDADKLFSWLKTESLALGNVKPKDLLDTNFGISLVRDELTRIEHGIFA